MTVKAPVKIADSPSCDSSITSYTFADEMAGTVQRISVGEITLIFVQDSPATVTTAPSRKPVPESVTSTATPRGVVLGLMVIRAGAVAVR